VQVWDALTGKLLLTYRGHAEVWAVSWSPDGKHIASAGDGSVVHLWNAATGKQIWLLDLE
jgi:WD40 repeat protein